MNVPEDDVAIVDVTGQRKNEQEWDHVLIDVALPAGLDQDRSIRSLKAALDRAGLKPRPRVQTTRKDSTVRVDVFLGDLHTHTLTLHAAAPKARPEAQGARSPRPQPSPPTPPPPASTAALEPTGPTVPTGPSPSVRPASSDKPRVAIVIDDFGLDASVTQCFLDAGPGLTFSVLPFLPYSEDVARRAHEQGTEVLLHMPMQPNGWPKVQPGEGALLVEMDQADIQARVRAAWRAVPHAVGMNNHMGSRFSADQTRMGWALEALKQEGGFYLDSRTGTRSSGYSVAKRLGIPAAGRTIFLDNDPDPRAVRYQLRKLVAWAKAHGQAVGIGHVHPTTCQVLVSEREYLLGRVELAPISQLVSPKREP
jgi:hypothetical protein